MSEGTERQEDPQLQTQSQSQPVVGKNHKGLNGWGRISGIGALVVGLGTVVQWPISYWKEGHDAGVKALEKAVEQEKRLLELEKFKSEISQTAASRGEYIRQNDARISDHDSRIKELEKGRIHR